MFICLDVDNQMYMFRSICLYSLSGQPTHDDDAYQVRSHPLADVRQLIQLFKRFGY
jgi:hypothetical protein